LHGGESPAAGPTHPSYKHGLYSKHVPKDFKETYAEMLKQGKKLLDIREQISILQVLLSRAIEAVPDDDTLTDSIDRISPLASTVANKIEQHFRTVKIAQETEDAPDLDLTLLDDDELDTFERLYRKAAGL
jgi:hypothetical protein